MARTRLLGPILVLAAALAASADIYEWNDADGDRRFTTDVSNVPGQYRDRVVLMVRDWPRAAPPPEEPRSPEPTPANRPEPPVAANAVVEVAAAPTPEPTPTPQTLGPVAPDQEVVTAPLGSGGVVPFVGRLAGGRRFAPTASAVQPAGPPAAAPEGMRGPAASPPFGAAGPPPVGAGGPAPAGPGAAPPRGAAGAPPR